MEDPRDRPTAADYANASAQTAQQSAESVHRENETLRGQMKDLRLEMDKMGHALMSLAYLTGQMGGLERAMAEYRPMTG